MKMLVPYRDFESSQGNSIERNPKVVLQRSTKAVIYETNVVKVVNV